MFRFWKLVYWHILAYNMPVLTSMYWSDHGLISPVGVAWQSMLHTTNLRFAFTNCSMPYPFICRKRGQDILAILLPLDEEHLAHSLCSLFLLTQGTSRCMCLSSFNSRHLYLDLYVIFYMFWSCKWIWLGAWMCIYLGKLYVAHCCSLFYNNRKLVEHVLCLASMASK